MAQRRLIPFFALLVVFAGFVSGCATAPKGPGGGATADPDALSQWVARGRIALTAQGEGGSGSFVWQQRSERTELTVRGPLGAGGFKVTSDGATLRVEDGSGQAIDGDAAREAVERQLGVALPLAEFRYWMLGVPAPESHGPAQQATGPVRGFTQSGWVVAYDSHQPAGPWSLPARMSARTGDARVRIVVDTWEVPPTP